METTKRLRFFFNFVFDHDKKKWKAIFEEVQHFRKKGHISFYFKSLIYKKSAGEVDNYITGEAVEKLKRTYLKFQGKHPVLGNKNAFHDFIEAKNIPGPIRLALIRKGKIIDDQNNSYALNEGSRVQSIINHLLKSHQSIFVKQVESDQGKDVFKIEDYASFRKLNLDNSADYIIEKGIEQHPLLNKINPFSVNTLRIYTVFSGDKVYILGSLLRMGVGKSFVDNASSGGIFVAYDIEENKLGKKAYRYAEYGGNSFFKHPKSGFVFENQLLPYNKEIIRLVKKAAYNFPELKIVGWDVAYTPDGPVLVEGNETPEIAGFQIIAKGLLSHKVMREMCESFNE